MKKPSLKIAALLLAVSPITATAVPMVVEAPCLNNAGAACTVGIDGLDIMGMTFNVDFVQGSYNSIFADNDPFYLGDQAGASAAIAAIIDILNDTTNGGTVAEPGDAGESLILVPYVAAGAAFSSQFAVGNPQEYVALSQPTAGLLFVDLAASNFEIVDVFATFQKVAAVPEPSILSLLAISLAGLGISRRKAKSQRRA